MTREISSQKLFRIGEVSRLTGVNPHILRYWESEFHILAPNRRLSKQRLYRQADIDLILTIKRLLEDEKYTLSGVKRYLAAHFAGETEAPPAHSPGPPDFQALLQVVRQELLAIRQLLAGHNQEN